MTIKRINAVSCAKIMGLLYAIIGLLVGCVAAFAALIGRFAANSFGGANYFTAFGMGAIIFFPLLYGALGFVMTWIAAAIYNVLAGVVGGVQVEVAPFPAAEWHPLRDKPGDLLA